MELELEPWPEGLPSPTEQISRHHIKLGLVWQVRSRRLVSSLSALHPSAFTSLTKTTRPSASPLTSSLHTHTPPHRSTAAPSIYQH
ncbi:hypothetical protein BDW66DRAFT_130902 [Aspergillus desertorum]